MSWFHKYAFWCHASSLVVVIVVVFFIDYYDFSSTIRPLRQSKTHNAHTHTHTRTNTDASNYTTRRQQRAHQRYARRSSERGAPQGRRARSGASLSVMPTKRSRVNQREGACRTEGNSEAQHVGNSMRQVKEKQNRAKHKERNTWETQCVKSRKSKTEHNNAKKTKTNQSKAKQTKSKANQSKAQRTNT